MMKIDEHNYEVFLIDYIEGNLDPEGKAALEQYMTIHPEVREELAEFQETILVPDTNVVFTNKEDLKQHSRRIVPIFFSSNTWMWAAAAAVILLFFLVGRTYFDNDVNNGTTPLANDTTQDTIDPQQHTHSNTANVAANDSNPQQEEATPNQPAVAQQQQPVKANSPQTKMPLPLPSPSNNDPNEADAPPIANQQKQNNPKPDKRPNYREQPMAHASQNHRQKPSNPVEPNAPTKPTEETNEPAPMAIAMANTNAAATPIEVTVIMSAEGEDAASNSNRKGPRLKGLLAQVKNFKSLEL